MLHYFLSSTDPPRFLFPRRSISIAWNGETGRVYEITVNLNSALIEVFTTMPENIKVPIISPDDNEVVTQAIKKDNRVIQRCLALGISNMDLVYSSATWPIGYIEDRPEYANLKRPYQVYMYTQNFNGDNAYAHPLPFVVIVDVIGPVVVAIENLPTHAEYDSGENQNGNVVPKTPSNYDSDFRPPNFLRRDDKPIKVSSPKGPSYKVKGNLIEWQKFKIRIGFTAREGLILHHVTYNDNGTVRPILYRASISELGSIYGDPRPPFHRKYSMDASQVGLGWLSDELISQEDCVGETTFFNVTVNNNFGDPVVIRKGICVTEEDAGILWKHVDFRNKKSVTVRSHRLVISFISTTGNYDFLLSWIFYQDASIQFEGSFTGIVSTNMLAVGGTNGGFGSVVFPQVNAQYHQHVVALRLDTEIDGNANSVEMRDVVPVTGPTGSNENPYGQGITVLNTPLKTQADGRTKISPLTGRVWVITNPQAIHPATNSPVGWKLMPSETAQIMAKPDSPMVNPKLGFLFDDVWITRYEEGHLYAGGTYLNNSGLPEWVGTDPGGSIENTDIVLWHVFSPVHIPRVEDFPVMSSESHQVWLKPHNFFIENPAIDVPPPRLRKHEF
ncbi:Copper amine oxidase 1 [Folsomia candida]|uniref:Amine oxidase n=2 Tax=Folsomia candida TaxID=158441 RepID=A0A226EWM9_FOLCA|nr:Copper amine oxidase 1 [Folsomia candida]